MHVETDHTGTELLTFGSIAAMAVASVLPWVGGGMGMMPVAAAATLGCGLAAGAVVRHGDGAAADDGALLALGLVVTALAVRSFNRFSASGGFGSVSRSPGPGVFLAALAGLALTGVAAHECWNEVAVADATGEAAPDAAD